MVLTGINVLSLLKGTTSAASVMPDTTFAAVLQLVMITSMKETKNEAVKL